MTDRNDRVKSALEIALERAQKLGSLSAKEKQKLKSKELACAGEALAERYLNGLPLRDIKLELNGYPEDDVRIVKRYLLTRVIDSVNIKNISMIPTVMGLIQDLSENTMLVQNITTILEDYEAAVQKAHQEQWTSLDALKRGELELKGISGSAVKPATDTSSEWVQILQRLESCYQDRFEKIKHKYPS